MGKTSDELREWVRRARADEHMDLRELDSIADRIDKEMVELPRDRDGVPIHVGDTVYLDDGCKTEVRRMQLSERENIICFDVYGDFFSVWPEHLTHNRPDSLERIADELEEWSEDNRVNGDGEVFYRAGDLAERVRKLAEKEGECDGTD